MKQFFKNIATSADTGESPFLMIALMIVSIVLTIFGMAGAVIALLEFPHIALPAIVIVCILRIIYAGVKGK